jgi:L-iditol 2-dehydrogenase
MLAVVKARPELGGIEIREVQTPSIKKSTEVLIKIKTCGICGTDVHFYEWMPHSRWITLPRILGHELAGEVVEIGKDVVNVKPGDRIVTETWGGCGHCYYCRTGQFNMCLNQQRLGQQVDGGMAEYVAIDQINLYTIPASLPYDQAAVIEPVGVAMHAMEHCTKNPGDNYVILGPGPIGLLAGMVAKASGAAKVFITGIGIDEKRLEIAARLGLTPINVEKENAEELIKDMTNGLGADIAIDTSGGANSLSQALRFVRLAGQIVLVGLAPAAEFDYTQIVRREAKVFGTWRRQPITWMRAIRLVANGVIDVKPLISHVMPMQQAEEAFKLLHERKGMKIILTAN